MYYDAYCNLFNLKEKTSLRESSWDKKGGNSDAVRIPSKKTKVIANLEGPGIINHFYCTLILPNPLEFRYAVIRMYWDDEKNPSVEVPLGDFFGVSNCRIRPINSLMITINKGASGSYGMNSYLPMPFSKRVRIEIENQGSTTLGGFNRAIWFHIDYDKVDKPWPDDVGYFHAHWNRENPTLISDDIKPRKKNVSLHKGKNLTGKDNYVMLETEGDGQLAGLILTVDNIVGGWYGEGDDMIFIDDDTWPPSFHGTGSEEIFGGGASPKHEYCTPYSGYHLIENFNWSGNNGMYRWYMNDTIRFKKRVRWTIEHGHANNFENDYSSVAYWYQKEPHKKFHVMRSAEERLPRMPKDYDELWMEAHNIGLKAYAIQEALKEDAPKELESLIQGTTSGLLEGRFDIVREDLKKLEPIVENLIKKE